jgi:hypothetical protein
MTLVRSIFLALVFTFAAGSVVHAADEAPAAEGTEKTEKTEKTEEKK